jgi:hypothetical protein
LVNAQKVPVVALVALLVAVVLFACPVLAQDSSQVSINQAKTTLKNSYEAALQAEDAGANITSLISALNNAAGLLSQAELAYASHDYVAANNYAAQSKNSLNGFDSQAASLKANAANVQTQHSETVLFSAVVAVAFLVVGFGLWFVLGRREKRLDGHPTI